jgi:2-methylcitrate dehydratase PrpD
LSAVRGHAVADQVTEFVHDLRWDDVPAEVRRHFGLLLCDLAAVSVAGRAAPAARIAADHASEVYGGDAATALYDGRRLSVPGAAWANGVLANALDYDDGHRLTKGHPGAIVVPAMLALAEAQGASPTELFEATLVAYEIAIRAGLMLHAREPRYHASAAWGALGVAAGAARILGLDHAALRHAIGIAEYHAPIALMSRAVTDPAMTKDACGWGGMIGTSSAMLALRGFTGLDSEFMLATDDLALGERWEVRALYLKPYPCCRWSQPAIDAALSLRGAIDSPEQIAKVTVRTFALAESLSRRQPHCTEEMQYSLVWPVATALARGAFGVHEVLQGFDDPLAARLAECTSVIIDETYSNAFPARRLTDVVLELDDGRLLRSGPREAEGEPQSTGWEAVVLDKARRFLSAADAPPPPGVPPVPPRGEVRGTPDELVALLAFACTSYTAMES